MSINFKNIIVIQKVEQDEIEIKKLGFLDCNERLKTKKFLSSPFKRK